MKQWLFILSLVGLASCNAQGIKVLKNTEKEPVTCTDCLQVRIKNSGFDNISKVEVTNDKGETFSFDGVKAGKTGNYQNITQLCQCGYDVNIYYQRSETNQTTLARQCRNIVKCTDYYKDKLTIEIKTGKLPEDLTAKEVRRTDVDLNFVKEP
ncbi:MAG: hypothetical protein EOP51_10370 [Sphingobacteriales bacterium]|nr:MAG: hypothetical protein EOP51_10370 [Sphingobacteriales bacterium]